MFLLDAQLNGNNIFLTPMQGVIINNGKLETLSMTEVAVAIEVATDAIYHKADSLADAEEKMYKLASFCLKKYKSRT